MRHISYTGIGTRYLNSGYSGVYPNKNYSVPYLAN